MQIESLAQFFQRLFPPAPLSKANTGQANRRQRRFTLSATALSLTLIAAASLSATSMATQCATLDRLITGRQLADRATASGLALRRAQGNDSAAIENFILSIRRQMGLPDVIAGQTYDHSDLENLDDRYSPHRGVFLLLERDKQIVGTGAVERLDETDGILRKLYLDDSLRGQGLGKLLLEQLIASARFFGFTHLALDTRPSMADALRLYEKRGFERQGGGDERDDKLRYRLRLPATR